jgi:hypothetical protein
MCFCSRLELLINQACGFAAGYDCIAGGRAAKNAQIQGVSKKQKTATDGAGMLKC